MPRDTTKQQDAFRYGMYVACKYAGASDEEGLAMAQEMEKHAAPLNWAGTAAKYTAEGIGSGLKWLGSGAANQASQVARGVASGTGGKVPDWAKQSIRWAKKNPRTVGAGIAGAPIVGGIGYGLMSGKGDEKAPGTAGGHQQQGQGGLTPQQMMMLSMILRGGMDPSMLPYMNQGFA
jgi:hypothetical protein